MRYSLVCLFCVCCFLPIAGCGPCYPETAPVQGTVTLNGKPLDSGEVQFWSDDGPAATGRIETDGKYRLTTFQPDDGAILGGHRIAVKSLQSTLDVSGLVLFAVPEHYQDPQTSGLTANVKPGMNLIDIDLVPDREGVKRDTQ